MLLGNATIKDMVYRLFDTMIYLILLVNNLTFFIFVHFCNLLLESFWVVSLWPLKIPWVLKSLKKFIVVIKLIVHLLLLVWTFRNIFSFRLVSLGSFAIIIIWVVRNLIGLMFDVNIRKVGVINCHFANCLTQFSPIKLLLRLNKCKVTRIAKSISSY